MLSYLRAQLRKAEKCKQMKMIIVGPPRQGKSTLLEILQTGRAPQVVHSEATIRTTKWELQRPAGSRAKVKDDWRAESLWEGGCAQGPCFLLSREPRTFSAQCLSPRIFARVVMYCFKPAPAKDSESSLKCPCIFSLTAELRFQASGSRPG